MTLLVPETAAWDVRPSDSETVYAEQRATDCSPFVPGEKETNAWWQDCPMMIASRFK